MHSQPLLASIGVLLVDDSYSERLLTRCQLEQIGYRVIEVDGGHEAIRLLDERHDEIDLILLDVEMPDLDGYEVASRIRQREQQGYGCWRPILFLSSLCSPEQMLIGVNSGGDDFLCKPVDVRVLAARLKAMARIAQRYHSVRCRKSALDRANSIEARCRRS
ncbi:response regulator [Marinobacterium maritimum]|uniref:response regulator n=1 Tax=Marinobacterium maritimum TaxID=500162 RepID=UPI003CD09DEE